MTTSRIIGGAAIGLPRLFSFLLLAVLALGAVTLPAQQSNLIGYWSGVDRGATFVLEIRPNGQYFEHAQSGSLVTSQSGQIRLRGTNRIVLSAAHSAPITQQMNRATPAAGGYSATQRIAIPLGAANTIVFTGPNRIIFTDERTHRSITMTRVY